MDFIIPIGRHGATSPTKAHVAPPPPIPPQATYHHILFTNSPINKKPRCPIQNFQEIMESPVRLLATRTHDAWYRCHQLFVSATSHAVHVCVSLPPTRTATQASGAVHATTTPSRRPPATDAQRRPMASLMSRAAGNLLLPASSCSAPAHHVPPSPPPPHVQSGRLCWIGNFFFVEADWIGSLLGVLWC